MDGSHDLIRCVIGDLADKFTLYVQRACPLAAAAVGDIRPLRLARPIDDASHDGDRQALFDIGRAPFHFPRDAFQIDLCAPAGRA